MKIKMKLLSDTIFGNGESIPGAEDISVVCDEKGFPYYKGGTFKGVFHEELERYMWWTYKDERKVESEIKRLLGKSGDNEFSEDKLVFSDFKLSEKVKLNMYKEIGENKEMILNSLSHIRAFTSMDENGAVKDGSLRNVRCINKGLYFYSEIKCDEKDKNTVKEVLSLIKFIGTMRNKGFGKVEITEE